MNNNLFGHDNLSHTIEQYDNVKIIGKDEYKGYIGSVTGIYNNPTLSEPLYIIELQATGSIIQRPAGKLKPMYHLKRNSM
jgi:hypothetical protein